MTLRHAKARVSGMNPSRSARLASAVCLLLACSRLAPCSVKVIELLESSQRPRVTVLLNGEAQHDVKLAIYRGFGVRDKPLLVLFTDRNGQAVVPALQPGKYLLRASPNKNLLGELYLHIKSTARLGDRFSMTLEHYDPPPTFEELVAVAEQSPATRKYVEFRGVVLDQTGSQISRVSIDVVVRGTNGTKHAARFRADDHGKFSTHLPDGDYVAFFSAPGFSVRVLPLTIAKTDGERELHVVLNVGPGTE